MVDGRSRVVSKTGWIFQFASEPQHYILAIAPGGFFGRRRLRIVAERATGTLHDVLQVDQRLSDEILIYLLELT